MVLVLFCFLENRIEKGNGYVLFSSLRRCWQLLAKGLAGEQGYKGQLIEKSSTFPKLIIS